MGQKARSLQEFHLHHGLSRLCGLGFTDVFLCRQSLRVAEASANKTLLVLLKAFQALLFSAQLCYVVTGDDSRAL